MEKKIALFAVALIIVFMSNSIVLALVPMGPPKALLGQDRWDLGIEYVHQSMDLEAVGPVQDIQPGLTITRKDRHNIDNLKSNIVMARAGYGINDDWDAFVRLGVADAQGDIERTFSDGAAPHEYDGFDGSFGLAWGIGTRATFWQDDEVSWGGLLQITWLEPGDSSIDMVGDPVFTGDAEIDIWEVQIAVGPTFRVDEGFRVYCGPFMHFVNGDLDLSGQTVDMGTDLGMEAACDVEEESQFGGYAGAHMDVDENTSCCIEFQFTSDAWGIGIGAARRF
jgi:opacity protein-like surface antigen